LVDGKHATNNSSSTAAAHAAQHAACRSKHEENNGDKTCEKSTMMKIVLIMRIKNEILQMRHRLTENFTYVV